MKILKLKILNLNSLRGANTIDFQTPPLNLGGLFAITGDTGAGKTTILDTLTLALYGRVPRNKDVKEVLSYQSTECLAEVEFEHNGQKLRAKWSLWKAHGKTDGNILGPKRELARFNPETETFDIIAESIREVNDEVENLTGLDYDRFRRSVLLAQGDFAAFLDSGERERSELLERITGTEIYSELSMAAYERNKEEEQALGDIEQQLKSLNILLPELRRELEEELQELEQTITQTRSEKEKLERQSHALRQRKQLREKIAILEKQSADLDQKFAQLQPQIERLQAFEKIAHLSKDLEWLAEKETELLALPGQKKSLDQQLSLQQKQLDDKTQQVKALQKQRQDRQQELSKLRPQWNRTRQLDHSLHELSSQIGDLVNKLNRQKKQADEIEKEILAGSQKIKQRQKAKKTLEQWLQKHRHLAALGNQLPLLREKINHYRQERQDRHARENKLRLLQEEAQKTQGEWEEKSGRQEQATRDLVKLEQAFNQLSPEDLPHDREGLIRQLEQQISQQEKNQGYQDQILDMVANYEHQLKEKQNTENHIQKLLEAEEKLNINILNRLDLLQELEQEVDFKAEIFRQQQLIANYEKDRHQLEPGTPCPLCGSTDHPFRQQELTPYTDRAKQDFDQARTRLDQQKEVYSGLLKEQARTTEKLRDLQNQDQVFQRNLEQSEQAIATLLKNLGRADLRAGLSLQAFRRQLLDDRQQLTLQIEQREKLEKLHRQIIKRERELLELSAATNNLKVQMEYQADKSRELEKLIREKNSALKKMAAELETSLQAFGLTLDKENPQKVLEQAAKIEREFQEQQEANQQIEKEIREGQQELDTARKLQQHRREEIAAREEELEKQSRFQADRQSKRAELLGDRDPDQAEEQFLKKSEEIITELDQGQAAKSELEKQVHLLRERSKELNQKQREIKEAVAKQTKNLQAAARKHGLADLPALQAAVISDEEARQIRKAQARLEKKKAELEGSRKENTAQLKKWEAEIAGSDDLKQLENQLLELDGQFQKALQKQGAIGEKLKTDDEKVATQQTLLAARQTQKQRCERWRRLNDLIGSADGKKFRTFAQGLTLERLIRFANVHLEHLNGRYEIYKLPEQDLEFVIIDTFQANNQRSVYTLSGGEKFLVSLALALGLSDLAGKKSQIRSLFIDEGFGTLDENSLDLAISTLENLQATGKNIGIISHVPALKERIGTRIQVEKQSDGFSQIRLIH